MAILAMTTVIFTYLPITIGNLPPWLKRISIGLVLMMIVIGARSLYWDLVQLAAGEHWTTIFNALGGQEISSVFNLGVIAACVIFVRAKKYLKI